MKLPKKLLVDIKRPTQLKFGEIVKGSRGSIQLSEMMSA